MLRSICKRLSYYSIQQFPYNFIQKTVSYVKNNAKKQIKQTTLCLLTGGISTSLTLSFFTKESDNNESFDLVTREADTLYNNYLIDNAYNLLRKYRNSENPELLWRLARVLCEQGKQCKNLQEKKRLFNEALEMVEKALKNEPELGCFGAHKWYAIVLDYLGEIEGTKSRLLKSREVKHHLEKALQINPIDATTWHLLGIWHFTFADLSSYLRLAAQVVYTTPPSSTYDEALRYFEKAEAINPGFYSSNTYYMALTKERLKNNDEALKLFKKAFFAIVVTIDDRKIHEKAREHLIKKYGYTDEKLMKEASTL